MPKLRLSSAPFYHALFCFLSLSFGFVFFFLQNPGFSGVNTHRHNKVPYFFNPDFLVLFFLFSSLSIAIFMFGKCQKKKKKEISSFYSPHPFSYVDASFFCEGEHHRCYIREGSLQLCADVFGIYLDTFTVLHKVLPPLPTHSVSLRSRRRQSYFVWKQSMSCQRCPWGTRGGGLWLCATYRCVRSPDCV